MLAEDPSGILSFLTCIDTFPQAKFDKIHAKQAIHFGKVLFLQMYLDIFRRKTRKHPFFEPKKNCLKIRVYRIAWLSSFSNDFPLVVICQIQQIACEKYSTIGSTFKQDNI